MCHSDNGGADGRAWEIHHYHAIGPGEYWTGFMSDHLRAITPTEMNSEVFKYALLSAEVKVIRVEQVDPSLEDVFLSLAGDRGQQKD